MRGRARAQRSFLPAWTGDVIGGLTFAGCLAAQGADAGRGWIDAVVRAAIGGAAFAVCMWWFVHRRQTRDNNPMLASLTRDQRRTAYRAAFRGAAPADPQIRHAAVELARRRLGESLNHRTPVAALLAALILVCIVAASVGSLWWAVGAAALAAVLVSMFVTPARLCRRLELLETPPDLTQDLRARHGSGSLRGPLPGG